MEDRLQRLRQSLTPRMWRQLLIAFIIFVGLVTAFAALADEVHEGDTLGIDVAVLEWVRTSQTPALDTVVPIVTDLGGAIGIVVIAGLIFGGLVWRRQYRRGLIVGVGVGGAAALNLVLKALFQRDRPELWQRLVTENSSSFPSGHAMASAALALTIVMVCWSTKWRWWAVGGGAVFMVVIGFTRMYLGVHYPTDIVAGWIVSAAWVLLVTAIIRHWRLQRS